MRRLPAAAAVLACLLTGCGDEDEPGRTVTVERGQAVRVVASEYEFDPSTVVVAGGRIRIELANEGSLAHNLKLFQGERELGGTPSFPGGRTEVAEVDLEPGRYRMVCTVGDHEELGMTGTLEAR
jgi:plastocyanin